MTGREKNSVANIEFAAGVENGFVTHKKNPLLKQSGGFVDVGGRYDFLFFS